MGYGRTTVHDISIPIIPRGDPRFVFVRVPAGSQCVACLSGLDEDNLPIREGDYERVVMSYTSVGISRVCIWRGRRRTNRDEDDLTNLMRDIGHPEGAHSIACTGLSVC
jgi:hypothetical protein